MGANSRGAQEGVHPPRSVIASLATHTVVVVTAVALPGSPSTDERKRKKKRRETERKKNKGKRSTRLSRREYESVGL